MQSKELTMGLGEALSRMMSVEMNRRSRVAPAEESLREFRMIVEALNAHRLTFEVDCESEPGVDGIEVFQRSAQTSCCRINLSKSGGSRTRG